MFERFTTDARTVVSAAVLHAQAMRSADVGPEQLFLALLDAASDPLAGVLADLNVPARRETIERSLAAVQRRGGLSSSDTSALSEVGIDLDQVISQVESVHGPGALAGSPARFRRRRRLTPQAKDVLRRALIEAVRRGDHHIGSEHLMLGLLAAPGAVVDVLASFGIGCADIERRLPRTARAG